MRWVFAAIGFVYGRFFGAILGYWLGSMIEQQSVRRRSVPAASGPGMRIDILQDFLTLAMAIARSDGHLDPREIRSIREFFERTMGFRGAALAWLKDALKAEAQYPGDWQQAAGRLSASLSQPDLAVLMRVLVAVALADGQFGANERSLLEQVGRAWQVNLPDAEQWRAPTMYRRDRVWALKIFLLPVTASREEIDKTYKKLVREKHPDRFAHLGEQFQKEAHEQFVEIQEAYRILSVA